jgi:hypothetical protein
MTSADIRSVDLVWDLQRERTTIGGALVLRQEGEMLARLHKCSALTVHLRVTESGRDLANRIGHIVFASSTYPFHLVEAVNYAIGWPSALERANDNFSYFAFSRIVSLYEQTGLKPRLCWSERAQSMALQARRQFAGHVYCVHLRSVPPFAPEESNADGEAWDEFFQMHASPNKCDFLLIGDDPLPNGLELRPGVTRIRSQHNHGLDLDVQLALISLADGFLGMASGLSTAANFSDTPHVIFKHPAHHSTEMEIELGTALSFPFASEKQQLWRKETSTALLEEAFHLISA